MAAAKKQYGQLTRQERLQRILDWKAAKPSTDEAWDEDVKDESLHFNYDKQLQKMKDNLDEKLPRVQKDLDKFTNWPDAVRYELNEQFEQMFKDAEIELIDKLEGKTLQEWIDGEFAEQQLFYTWKVEKIKQSIERIEKEQDLRTRGVVTRKFLINEKEK